MGAPSDTDTEAAQDDAVDDGWTADSPAHNDRTTAGLYVDPASVGKLTAGKHLVTANRDSDRTANGVDTEPTARALSEDSAVTALDQTLAMLEGPDAGGNNSGGDTNGADTSGTKLGLGVVAPSPRPAFVLLDPEKGPIALDKDQSLVQPERSPLDLVMREADLAAAPRAAHTSGDSSRFIATLVGNQPPPQIAADVSAITPIQPVLRRPGHRRKWIAAGALAATAVLGTAFAMTTRKEEPRTSASEAAKVSEPAVPEVAGLAATPSHVATATPPNPSEVAAPTDPNNEPTVPAEAAPPAKLQTVAVARTSETAAKRTESADEKPATAKKTVAIKEATAKPTTAKAATKTTTAKPSTAKKTVATKGATTKKSSTAKASLMTAKPTTAKKAVATKEATAKKSSTATKPVPAKKTASSSTEKKPATAKKASTAKKPADKKPAPAKKTTTAKKTTAKKS